MHVHEPSAESTPAPVAQEPSAESTPAPAVHAQQPSAESTAPLRRESTAPAARAESTPAPRVSAPLPLLELMNLEFGDLIGRKDAW